MHLTQGLELYPELSVTQLLFTDVRDAGELRRSAAEGRIGCALVNPAMLVSPFQALLAANKAVHAQRTGKMKTRGLYTEIIFNLSPGNNISEALKRLGVGDGADSVHVTLVHAKNESLGEFLADIAARAGGQQLPVERLSMLSNPERIREMYEVSTQEERSGTLLDAVVCRMATKDAL